MNCNLYSKTFHHSLGVLMLMAVSLLIPEVLLFQNRFAQLDVLLLRLTFVIGVVTPLVWFRPNRGRNVGSSRPKGLLTMSLMLLVVTAIGCIILAGLFLEWWTWIPLYQYGPTAHTTLVLIGTVSTILGVYALVQAQLVDYRWRTVYLIGLTVLVACVAQLTLLTSVDLSTSPYLWSFLL